MMNAIGPSNNTPAPAPGTPEYTLKIGDKVVPVPDENRATAAEIDTKKDDYFLTQQELEDYVAKGDGDTRPAERDLKDQTNEFACSLAKVPNPYASGYRDFPTLIKDFDALAAKNPNYMKKEILGKTPEGRDIVAYKLSEGAQGDTSNKPGVVITGCHHAREWMTVEAPLTLAKNMLDGIGDDPDKQKRLHDGEVWIVPCANPDGYQYSRDTDNLWRKNRDVLGTDQAGKPTTAVGVDLNRNYGEDTLNHHIIFRPDGDTPENTADDFGATSDDPFSEVYRGKSAASEPEVKAMQDLEMRPNIRGTLDFHSYGDDLLYPWSHTAVKPTEEAFYEKLGGQIADATGYKLEPGIGLYPNSGSSDIFQEANSIRTFTVEMGQSFQPNPSLIPEITGKASTAATIFMDEIIKDGKDGSLGPKVPIEMPVAQATPPTRGLVAAPPKPEVRTDSSPTARYFDPEG